MTSTGSGSTDPLTQDLVQQQARVTDLQRLEQLRREETDIQSRLGLTSSSSSTRKRRRRHRHGSSSSESDSNSGPEIKVKNITQLRVTSSYRHREDWLADLQRAFSGAPRRYRSDRRKILLGVENMDTDLRAKWARRVQDSAAQRALNPTSSDPPVEKDWDGFVAWSLEALGIDQLAHICKDLDRARQREDQAPAAFQNYLESLESHLPRDCEDIRAYKFYAKLAPTLFQQIDCAAPTIPKTCKEVLDLATRFWETGGRGKAAIGTGSTGNSSTDRHEQSWWRRTEEGARSSTGDQTSGGQGSGSAGTGGAKPPSAQTQTSDGRGTGESQRNRSNTQTQDEIREGQRARGECYKCGKKGHLARDCTDGEKKQWIKPEDPKKKME